MTDFKYDGPNGGNAASDDEQFRASGNPYAQGLKPRATARSTEAGFAGSPLGYYTNPQVQSSNPYSAGAPGMSESVDNGNFWNDRMSSAQPMQWPDPGEAGIWSDESFGKSGMGRS